MSKSQKAVYSRKTREIEDLKRQVTKLRAESALVESNFYVRYHESTDTIGINIRFTMEELIRSPFPRYSVESMVRRGVDAILANAGVQSDAS